MWALTSFEVVNVGLPARTRQGSLDCLALLVGKESLFLQGLDCEDEVGWRYITDEPRNCLSMEDYLRSMSRFQ
jgi:hypothetical protein